MVAKPPPISLLYKCFDRNSVFDVLICIFVPIKRTSIFVMFCQSSSINMVISIILLCSNSPIKWSSITSHVLSYCGCRYLNHFGVMMSLHQVILLTIYLLHLLAVSFYILCCFLLILFTPYPRRFLDAACEVHALDLGRINLIPKSIRDVFLLPLHFNLGSPPMHPSHYMHTSVPSPHHLTWSPCKCMVHHLLWSPCVVARPKVCMFHLSPPPHVLIHREIWLLL